MKRNEMKIIIENESDLVQIVLIDHLVLVVTVFEMFAIDQVVLHVVFEDSIHMRILFINVERKSLFTRLFNRTC